MTPKKKEHLENRRAKKIYYGQKISEPASLRLKGLNYIYRSRSDERESKSHESMKKNSENSGRLSKSQHYLQSQSRKRAREVN